MKPSVRGLVSVLSGLILAGLLGACGMRSEGETDSRTVRQKTRAVSPDDPAATRQFRFELDGAAYLIELEKKSPSVSLGYRHERLSADGKKSLAKSSVSDCFFQGRVFDAGSGELVAGSYVSVTTCLETAGHPLGDAVRGFISFKDAVWALAPSSEPKGPSGGVFHTLRSAASWRLGAKNALTKTIELVPSRRSVQQATSIWEGTPLETKLVELYLISDATRGGALGDQAESAALELIANVNAIFGGSGLEPRVRIVLAGLLELDFEPWTWPSSGGGEVDAAVSLELLTEWAAQADLPHHDARMLLTGRDLNGNTAGVAYVGAMCGGSASLLIQTTPQIGALAAEVASHELGHSLGMTHDGDGDGCPQSGFLMAAVASSGGLSDPKFSSCSQSEFSAFLGGEFGPGCINDVPVEVAAAICGDAALGPGEECDCGDSDCSEIDPCCDGATCKLAAGAECSSFNDPTACCVECRMATLEEDVTCRPARDECDTAEVCTGYSFDCPGDTFPDQGGSCTDVAGGEGTCFSGTCTSRGVQCLELSSRYGEDFSAPSSPCQNGMGCGQVVCQNGGTCVLLQGETPPDGIACGESSSCQQGECVPSSEVDHCPRDPEKTTPEVCGCGVSDVDTDLDGTPDCLDACPENDTKLEPGECGCDAPEIDDEGITVCGDTCPEDGAKTEPGQCGCGTPDTDRDSDGTADCNDLCPDNPQKVSPDVVGCDVVATGSGGGPGGSGGSSPSGVGGQGAAATNTGGAGAASSLPPASGGCSIRGQQGAPSFGSAGIFALLVLGWARRRSRGPAGLPGSLSA